MDGKIRQRTLTLDELIEKIIRGRIVPVIGSELCILNKLNSQPEDPPIYLYDFMAEKLAEKGHIPNKLDKLHIIAADEALNSMDVYTEMKDIYADLENGKYPQYSMSYDCFDELAGIGQFKIFLSVTFADHLQKRLIETHKKNVTVINFSLSSTDDNQKPESTEEIREDSIIIINLLGSIKDENKQFALTEEEYLEYFFHIISGAEGAFNLNKAILNKIKNCSFLYLGCGLPDWYARYIVRGLTQKRYLNHRFPGNIFIDEYDSFTPVTRKFFIRYNAHVIDDTTEIYDPLRLGQIAKGKNKALTFISTLANRIKAKNKGAQEQEADSKPKWKYEGKVFICYFGEDRQRAEVLFDRLASRGINCWLDQVDLPAGPHQLEIKDNIANCSVFLPLISARLFAKMEQTDKENELNKLVPGFTPKPYPYCVSEEWRHIMGRLRVNEYYADSNLQSKIVPFVITTYLYDGISKTDSRIPAAFRAQKVYSDPAEEDKLLTDIDNFLSQQQK